LLFLAAGSVIIAMHHEQDMRRMGGLRKYMPVTYWTALIGTLALIGFPGFSGYFSKDALIEAVHESAIPGAGYAYFCVVAGVFVTAFYSFRLLFLTFHGQERFAPADAGHHDHHGSDEATHVTTDAEAGHEPDVSGDAGDGHVDAAAADHSHGHDGHAGPPRESPWVVTLPLVLLAIPSVIIGWFTIDPLLFGGFFDGAIRVTDDHAVLQRLGEEFHGPAQFVLHGFMGPAVWLAAAGAALAWFLYLRRPELAEVARQKSGGLYTLLVNKYYFDWFNEKVIAAGSRGLGHALWKGGDVAVIDGAAVNGSARLVGWVANAARGLQSGYVYHYAFATIIGLSVLLAWLLWRS
jgi:NADH-quinone oxidoreductase subunit L